MIKFYVALIAIFPLLGISTNVNIRAYKHYEIVEWGEIDQNINLKEDSTQFKYELSAKNTSWSQTLELKFFESNDSIAYRIKSENLEKGNKTIITGIARLLEESPYGFESISDDETDELIFVREYLFEYNGNPFVIRLERKNFNRAQIIPKSLESKKLSERINFDLTMRRRR